MILLDLTHTSHTQARTGIQKVCRSLHRELRAVGSLQAITWDHYATQWRVLERWEQSLLQPNATTRKRGAQWPLIARARGTFRKWRGQTEPLPSGANALIVPELFSPQVAAALPSLMNQVKGPRVALFHDAIALKFPELSAPKTVARFPGYLQELAQFDGIAAVSADSRDSLIDYWRWLGLGKTPPVKAIPLGIDAPVSTFSETGAGDSEAKPTILCVGSIEGRKNHQALLTACEKLWANGMSFSLRLIGLAQTVTGKAALETIQRLQAQGHPLRYDGPVSDEVLAQAYRDCRFTVYPSLIEGFGLPVLESISYGKPCVCSARGALGESARDGGCVALPRVDAPSLAAGIKLLLQSDAELASLTEQARQRKLRSWAEYAADLQGWMGQLRRNNE